MQQAESVARAAIVEYCELLWYRGLVAGNSGNVSVRLDDGTLLVTPSGVSLRALDRDAIVATDPTGVPLDGAGRPTSELPLHIAAYRVRPEARCVIHTHPTFCVAWSKTGALFARDTVGAIESLGSIAWTPYARSGTRELAEICSHAFAAPCDTIVMERHGLSVLGGDLETAFIRTDLAEQTARIEYAAVLLARAQSGRKPGATRRRIKRRMSDDRVPFPFDDLHAAGADHAEYRAALTDFQREYGNPTPDRERLSAHAERVRRFDGIAGPFERWWLDPRVAAFIAELNATGI